MNYITVMGSGVLVYIPSSMKTGWAIRMLLGEVHMPTRHTHRPRDIVNLQLFFQNKQIRLKESSEIKYIINLRMTDQAETCSWMKIRNESLYSIDYLLRCVDGFLTSKENVKCGVNVTAKMYFEIF
jgi:hypothetical protein